MSKRPIAAEAKDKARRSYIKKRSLVAIIVTGGLGIALLVLVFLGMAFHESFFQWLNSWPGSLGWLKVVLGILLAIGFVVFFFLALMLTYLTLRQRWAKAKFRVELLIFIPTLLLSIAVKIAVIILDAQLFASEELLTDTAGAILKAIYMAIGGLSFEGLPDIAGLRELQLIPFYGTSIVTGLVFLGVIGSTFAYEGYSYVLLRVLYGPFRGKLHYNTYVFTALNDETLCLACSVAEYDSDAVIIFAGPSLEPFDRHDEQCAEVMGNGFLYWSYYENPEESIAAALGLKKKNNKDGKLFYVFAFDTDENKVPEEEINADAIFDDGKARMNHPDEFYIHYILLGKGENDFQAYEVMRSRNLDNKTSNLSLWTEAKSVANQVASYMKSADAIDIVIPKKDITRVRTIGFGETGRAITKEIYVQSTLVSFSSCDNENPVESKFEADIFDARSLEIAGFFKKQNPYAICYQKGNNPAITEDKEGLNCPAFIFNEKNYTHIDVVTEQENASEKTPFDYVVVATGDDRESINIANSIISERLTANDEQKLVIFIAVYDKRNNIYLTAPQEMLMALSKKEDDAAPREKARQRFQNEVDQIMRTNRFATREEALTYRKNIYRYNDNLIAIVIGNRVDTFQFNHIHYQRRSANFDSVYNNISKKINYYSGNPSQDDAKSWICSLSSLKAYFQKGIKPGEEATKAIRLTVESILEEYKGSGKGSTEDMESAWNNLSLWDRQSNIELGYYARTYYEFVKAEYPDVYNFIVGCSTKGASLPLVDEKKLYQVMALMIYNEHARWNRVHIAAGWKFGVRDKPHRIHHCLTSMLNLAKDEPIPWTYMYDLANVLHSICSYAKIESSETIK